MIAFISTLNQSGVSTHSLKSIYDLIWVMIPLVQFQKDKYTITQVILCILGNMLASVSSLRLFSYHFKSQHPKLILTFLL